MEKLSRKQLRKMADDCFALAEQTGQDRGALIRPPSGVVNDAVALRLASLRGEEWVAGIAEGLNPVRVSVMNVAVEHAVKIQNFNKWLGLI